MTLFTLNKQMTLFYGLLLKKIKSSIR